MSSIAMEEYELMKDSKYRVYVSAVDKALKNFEYTSEWADLISALGKLNKVLMNNMKFPVIPRRIKISKRLAQCMHPALPSGVHLKALETYDIIFKCMGTNRLSHELFIYSAGLFPLLGHSAMNVRPSLLTVYETHFVPLGERLRPGLSGFLSGVLPGLEEGSDHFDRTNSLLEKVCDGVGQNHFYGCLWECIASNAGIRLPAISFVLSHFNKKLSMEDQLYIMGTNIDMMVSALCAAVQDASVLVQRSALDLLLIGFPMHNSQLLKCDMIQLVTAALTTILRRDMSLNRRLYAWLLGSEVNISLLSSEHPLVKRTRSVESESDGSLNPYFELYSREMLIQAIKTILGHSINESIPDLRPYRLLVSLLDKPDIGPVILDDILFEVFRTLYLACEGSVLNINEPHESASKHKKKNDHSPTIYKGSQELLKTANLLFSTLEPYYIWHYLGIMFEKACKESIHSCKKVCDENQNLSSRTSPKQSRKFTFEAVHNQPVGQTKNVKVVRSIGSGQPDMLEICALTEFLLDMVSLETYIETPTEHLPELFLHVVIVLTENCHVLLPLEITKSLKLCQKILSKVQPSLNAIYAYGEEVSQSESKLQASDLYKSQSMFSKASTNSEFNLHSEQADQDNYVSQDTCDFVVVDSSNRLSEESEVSKALLENCEDNKISWLERVSEHGVKNQSLALDFSNIDRGSPARSRHESVMKEGLRQYEEFYVKFMSSHVVPCGETDIFELFKLLIVQPQETNRDRIMRLEHLLYKCLHKKCNGESLLKCKGMSSVKSDKCPVTISARNTSEFLDSAQCACNLLVELSTFPTYCPPGATPLVDTEQDQIGPMPEKFPKWLQVLLVCACLLSRNDYRFQLMSVATVLDLMSLLNSVQSAASDAAANSGDNGDGSPHHGVITVVIVPLLKQSHIKQIENNTCVFQEIASSLWDHLGSLPSAYHMQCVELLHQLHNVVPYSDIVEDVIGESLTYLNGECPENLMEAFQRFSTLWHLSREIESKVVVNRNHRTFDKSLLRMLDNLRLPSNPLKIQAQSWFLHAMLRGDISRILEPLLLMLLDPVTARLSVLHVSIEHSNTVLTKDGNESEDGTAKIYAISSVDGNIIYHVSNDSYITERKGNPVKAKRIFAVTTLANDNNDSHYITENSYIREFDCPSFHDSNYLKSNISLFVNPFMNAPVEGGQDEFEENAEKSTLDFRNVTRFDPNKMKKDLSCEDGDSIGSDTTGFEAVNESLVRSWSAGEVSSGNVYSSDVTDSTENLGPFGEETKGSSTSFQVVEGILHDVLEIVVNRCSQNELHLMEKERESLSFGSSSDLKDGKQQKLSVHQLHSHILLYCQVYDSQRTLYTLETLKNLIVTNSRMFLCAVSTTSISNSRTSRSSEIQALLVRHRKSVFGKNFHGEVSSDFASTYRSSMYLEVLISVCLYFARSYYPNLGQMRLTDEEIVGNREVQLQSAEVLMLIVSELIPIVRDSGKGFASYIGDLLTRCKVQKVVLHCVLSSVYNMRRRDSSSDKELTFTEEIIRFNEMAQTERGTGPRKCQHGVSDHSEGFQVQLLRLLLSLIMLEEQVNLQKTEIENTASKENIKMPKFVMQTHQLKYIPGRPITQQSMFLASITSALKLHHMKHLHQHWTTLVTSALPFMGQSLTHVVINVINQLCHNLEKLAKCYDANSKSSENGNAIPADYAVTQLEALTVLCHYCLLDSTQQLSHAFNQPLVSSGGSMQMSLPGANPGQVINNLIHVFTPTLQQQSLNPGKEKSVQIDSHIHARRTVLSNLPRIIASVATLWQAIISCTERENQNYVMGSPRVLKHHLLEFLSPISLHHGSNFLAAIAVAWQERRSKESDPKMVLPVSSPDQQVMVYLVSAIRVMPIDTLVQTVHQVVKQPPPIQGGQEMPLEVSLLEFFYTYMRQTATGSQLIESWSSLLGLLRDGLTLTPSAQFLMLAVLNEFVQKAPVMLEKKDQRDLQDITSKLVESCAQIAGACLEQTTWLRRNLAVREEMQLEANSSLVGATKDKDGSGLRSTPSATSVAQYSVQAQSVLAELLAPLLDVTFGSQEKEKVVTLLNCVMYNITPYLKNHSRRNVASFHACSQLLANMSGYQYTRKAWRRDVFDLLLDPSLFQMEPPCLPYWRTIIDNLMTHDTTTFRDLMSRVSVAQSGSLSLFSSREQEYEQRAQLLKRLAFVIFCSEMDQYQKLMPEIQERLAESLRLPQVVPSVQAQVFLCFRVLLLRMSPQHVTSLWPIIISEMVQVFLHIEQEFNTDTEEFRRHSRETEEISFSESVHPAVHFGYRFGISHIRLLSALDSSWVVNSNNGLHAHGHPAWLQLQLATCKLLDLALLLPAHRLPQFQMYRWAFVGDADTTSSNESSQAEEETKARSPDFVPHVTRLAKLMDKKVQMPVAQLPHIPGKLLLTMNSIKSLQELHSFFITLSQSFSRLHSQSPPALLHQDSSSMRIYTPKANAESSRGMNDIMQDIESVIERDFLEPMPTR